MRKNKLSLKLRCIAIFVLINSLFICPSLSYGARIAFAYTQKDVDLEVKKKDEAKKSIQNVQQEKKKASEQKKENDQQIANCERVIAELNAKIAQHSGAVLASQAELREIEEQICDRRKLMKARIRFVHENKNISYLKILMSSQNFADFLTKTEVILALALHDREAIKDMDEIYKSKEKCTNLIEQESNLERSTKLKLSYEVSVLNEKNKANDKYIEDLVANEAEYRKAYITAEAAEKKIKEQLTLSEYAALDSIISGFMWPSPSCGLVTSPYGIRYHPVLRENKFHSGIDIGASYGTNVLASNDGVVRNASWNSGYGNCVVIDHGGGRATLYGHLSSMNVAVGQRIGRGNVIGRVGSTGLSTGPHLHFEVLINGVAQNPLNFVHY